MLDNRLIVNWMTLKTLGWPHDRKTTRQMIKDGRFPKPIGFCPENPKFTLEWYYVDIQDFLAHQCKTYPHMCKF